MTVIARSLTSAGAVPAATAWAKVATKELYSGRPCSRVREGHVDEASADVCCGPLEFERQRLSHARMTSPMTRGSCWCRSAASSGRRRVRQRRHPRPSACWPPLPLARTDSSPPCGPPHQRPRRPLADHPGGPRDRDYLMVGQRRPPARGCATPGSRRRRSGPPSSLGLHARPNRRQPRHSSFVSSRSSWRVLADV